MGPRRARAAARARPQRPERPAGADRGRRAAGSTRRSSPATSCSRPSCARTTRTLAAARTRRCSPASLRRGGLRVHVGPIVVQHRPRVRRAPARARAQPARSPSTWSRRGSPTARPAAPPDRRCASCSTRRGYEIHRPARAAVAAPARLPRAARGERAARGVGARRWATREVAARRPARLVRGRDARRSRSSSARSSCAARPVYVRKQIVHNAPRRRRARAPRRGLRRRARRGAGRRDRDLLRARRLAGGARGRGRARARRDRRDLPARREGARRGAPLRRRGLPDRAGRPRRPRGGRGHDRRGARAHARRSRRSTRRRALELDGDRPVACLTQTTLAVDETTPDRRRPCASAAPTSSVPASDDICYATQNRQDAVRAIADALRPGAGRRLAELVELAPPRRGRRARGRAAPRSSSAPRTIPPALLAGVRRGRRHRGRVGARAARRAGRQRARRPRRRVAAEHAVASEDTTSTCLPRCAPDGVAPRRQRRIGTTCPYPSARACASAPTSCARSSRAASASRCSSSSSRCTSATSRASGCGKIQQPDELLRRRMPVEDAVAAIEESRRADGLDRGRRAADAPRHPHDRGGADQAAQVRVPVHERAADGAQDGPLHALAVLRLGGPHRRPARAPRRVRRTATASSTRRSRRSPRPSAAASA